MKKCPRVVQLACQRADILQNTGFVVGQHDRYQLRSLRQQMPIRRLIHPAFCIDRQSAQLPALPNKLFGRSQHTRMLDGTDGQQSGLEPCGRALDEQIVGFRTPAGERDLGSVRANCRRHLFACLVDGPACGPPVFVPTGGVAEVVAAPRQHGFPNDRIDRCRRVMIKIDRCRHRYPMLGPTERRRESMHRPDAHP